MSSYPHCWGLPGRRCPQIGHRTSWKCRKQKQRSRFRGGNRWNKTMMIYIYMYVFMWLFIYIYMVPPQRSTLIFLWGRVAHIYIYKRVRFIFFSRGSFSRSIFPWGRGTRRCQTAAQTHSRTTSRRDTPAEIHQVFWCFLGRDICPENFFQSFCSILGFCWVCAACSSLLEMADGVEAIKEWPF